MVTSTQATEGLFHLAADVPFRIAPERAQALSDEVFGEAPLEVRSSSIEAFFSAIPPERRVYLSFAGLASVWCLSFAAYHTMDVASRLAVAPELAKAQTVDIGMLWAEMRLTGYVDYARRLFVEDEDWPIGLAVPDPASALDTDDGRVNNLFFGALSWLMLHEIGHIAHDHAKLVGRELMLGQEWEADRFATRWALEHATGHEREFRVIAIIVALAWLLLFEQVKYGGGDHPSAIRRFREAAMSFELGEDSPALENAVYLLKAIFDPAGAMPERMTARQAFEWMVDRLEELLPRR